MAGRRRRPARAAAAGPAPVPSRRARAGKKGGRGPAPVADPTPLHRRSGPVSLIPSAARSRRPAAAHRRPGGAPAGCGCPYS